MLKKGKTRRAARKPKISEISIYTININGFLSKIDSLDSIINNIEPDVITINETKTKNAGKIKDFFKERGYETLIRPAGGIVVAARSKLKIINVTTSPNPSIIAGLIPGLNIRIITAYGPQENTPKEDRQDFFDELSTEIQKCEYADNNPIIVGDLNAKIKAKEERVEAISPNGEMLVEVIKNHALEVLNFHTQCTGLWTRVQLVNGETVKSVIDYCITNSKMSQKLGNMMV